MKHQDPSWDDNQMTRRDYNRARRDVRIERRLASIPRYAGLLVPQTKSAWGAVLAKVGIDGLVQVPTTFYAVSDFPGSQPYPPRLHYQRESVLFQVTHNKGIQ